MKLELPEVKPSFIVDQRGHKKQVVLDIKQFQQLLETLEDFYIMAQAAVEKAKKEESMTLTEFTKKMKAHDGKGK